MNRPSPPAGCPVASCLFVCLLLALVSTQPAAHAEQPDGGAALPSPNDVRPSPPPMQPARTGHRYRIDAALHPSDHAIEGRQRIVWRNHGERPVDTLHFHLYLNAFAHDDTVFMRETGGRLRGVQARGRGWTRVEAMRLAGGPDLLPEAETELTEGDRTQMRVPLPSPVPPGAAIELDVRFRSKLPPLFARSGYVGSFHMVGQWFPKLAKLEPDGTWVTFPYHGHGEFYADFAHYDLSIRTPPGWVVGATGRRLARRQEGEQVIHRFVAERVHDAAFTAWPHFRQRHLDIDGGPEVRLLYPPGYEAAVETHLETTERALHYFGELYGQYPYQVLTIVVPPRGAEGGAAMEYPMLFVTAGPWFTLPGVRVGVHEEITAHELAHQWFQGLVATNEVRWPMLDEGLTQWASWDYLRARYGRDRSAFGPPWPAIDGFELLRIGALRFGDTPPPGRPAHGFEGNDYGRSVYARTAVVLETVARTWGRDRLHRALGRYARRYRFGHPEPQDLFRVFDEVYWQGFAARIVEPALMRGATAEQTLRSIRAEDDGSRVVAERTGQLPLPSTVHLQLDDGSSRLLPWKGSRARFEHEVDGASVVTARAAPHRHNLLDRARLDDAKSSDHAGATAGFAPLLALSQLLLGTLGP